MEELMTMTAASHGWVVVEEPPPRDPNAMRPWERALTAEAR
jgi:hypothetical protein